LRDAPTGFIFKNFTLNHTVCVWFVFISEQIDFYFTPHEMIGVYNRDEKFDIQRTVHRDLVL